MTTSPTAWPARRRTRRKRATRGWPRSPPPSARSSGSYRLKEDNKGGNEAIGVSVEDANERTRTLWDRYAPRYDRQVARSERLLFPDGRAWVCSQAYGDVLEVAV